MCSTHRFITFWRFKGTLNLTLDLPFCVVIIPGQGPFHSDVITPGQGRAFVQKCPMLNEEGDFASLAPKVQRFVAEKAELMNPAGIYICDGSQKEFDDIVDKLVERGVLTPLKAYENNFSPVRIGTTVADQRPAKEGEGDCQ
ncbi:hypothetical protein TELCIR_08628 [Teladorsagia circumcincta]|uniref:Phosphoenolpyruvate carboxykinase GTP-utilising N-terminal domain-containing protein n=1 Tax=Teladorsagia circumcincta TaxID=45464 RepID=A0A2G9UJ73_TELCI|nr:hypothetical protein TELCIR_08628 [Teladorsagia circumcincta]